MLDPATWSAGNYSEAYNHHQQRSARTIMTEKPETHRRFLLFGGVEHEPAGGIRDLLSSHDTIDEALQHAEDVARDGYVPPDPQILSDGRISTAHARGWPIEWWHVYDIDSAEVVAEMETFGLPTCDDP